MPFEFIVLEIPSVLLIRPNIFGDDLRPFCGKFEYVHGDSLATVADLLNKSISSWEEDVVSFLGEEEA